MPQFVVEYRMKMQEYVYRKCSLVVADDARTASRKIADQLAVELRFDYKFHSCRELKK